VDIEHRDTPGDGQKEGRLMRRSRWVLALALVAVVVVAVACTPKSEDQAATTIDPSASHAPVTIEIWSGWSADREVRQFNAIFDDFTAKYPWITVKSTTGIGDQKIVQAINSGTAPDAVLSFGLDSVGKFCESGAWQDLNPYIEQNNFDVSVFPDSIAKYTSLNGKRCAFPFLTDVYGLYYNQDMFDAAGITEPPKTISEMVQDAKDLTVFNDDGSIKVAGLVPWSGYYETNPVTMSVPANCAFYKDEGASSNFADPCWSDILGWQKELVDFYGAGNLADFVAGQGDEFGSKQDFQVGRTAMNIDGEWRTAFIADGAPDLNYGTAPMPVPDDAADTYGIGQVGGTIIGIPKGSPNPAEAWLLVSWMATDTKTLVYMANNVRNVPTTFDSLASPDLDVTPQFQTFLDIFSNPASHYKETTAIGDGDQAVIASVFEDWQAGKIDDADLQGRLDSAAQEVDDLLTESQI
jgi:multiple sugar transport system substrate-binding protein